MKRLTSFMMRAFVAYYCLFFLSSSTFAQKPLTKAAIQDFANSCEFQAKYNQNQNFMLQVMMQGLARKVGGFQKADVVIRSTGIDKEAREMVFEGFYLMSGGDPDKLFLHLNQWGLSAANSKEISSYISAKYGSKREAPKKAENAVFQGTKRFTDADSVYCREVTIKGNSITIKLFPASKNTEFKDKTKVIATETGYIKNGKIYIRDGNEYRSDYYKIEDGNLIVNYNVGD